MSQFMLESHMYLILPVFLRVSRSVDLRSFRGALSFTSPVNMVNKDCVLVTECARPFYCGFWVPSCASRLVSNNCLFDHAIMACISWLLNLSCGLVADFQPGAEAINWIWDVWNLLQHRYKWLCCFLIVRYSKQAVNIIRNICVWHSVLWSFMHKNLRRV